MAKMETAVVLRFHSIEEVDLMSKALKQLNENRIISGSRVSIESYARTGPTDASRVVQRIPQLNIEVDYKTVSDKARCVGRGVLEAIMVHLNQ